MRIFLLQSLCLLFFNIYAQGQSDTSNAKLEPYIFMDIYYVHSFNNTNKNVPSFIYNYNRYNEIAVNQAILGAKINEPTYRAALGFHAGSYVTSNYAAETQPIVRHIYEANIGYKLKEKLWVDAGIFSSYIGYETSISFDMWTLTRPVMAENYPYYQSGVKLSYEPNQKWFFSGLILNGWQNINETNTNKPIGAQIQYKPTSKILLNTSLFWGKEKAAIDSSSEIANRRSFIDFYGIFQLTNQWSAALYIDAGSQKITSINRTAPWSAITAMLRYMPTIKSAVCIRAEHYNDKYGVMIPSYALNGFNLSNISLNVDYFLNKHLLARIEGKAFLTPDKIFETDDNLNTNRSFIIASSVSFKF